MDSVESPPTSALGYVARALVLGALAVAAVQVARIPSGGIPPSPSGAPAARTEAASSFVERHVGYQLRHPIDWKTFAAGGAVWVVPPEVSGWTASRPLERNGTLVEHPRSFFVRVTSFREACTRCHNPFQRRYGWARDAGAFVVSGSTALDGRVTLQAEITYPEEPEHELGSCRCNEVGYWCPGCVVTAWGVTWSDEWYLLVEVVAPDEEAAAAHRATALQIAASIQPFAPNVSVAPGE